MSAAAEPSARRDLLSPEQSDRKKNIGQSVCATGEEERTISRMMNIAGVPAAYVPMRTNRNAEYTAPGTAKVSRTLRKPGVRSKTHKIR